MAQAPDAGTVIVPLATNPVALTVSSGPPLPAAVAQIVVLPGPTARAAGDTIAYRAIAVFGDGTSQDVTLAARW